MDIAVLLTLLGGVALAVNRLTEIIKPAFAGLSDQQESIAIRMTSIALGVAITVGGGESFNLLAVSPVYGQLNPMAGLIVTGIIVGGFSNGWDKIASLFNPPPPASVSKIELTAERSEPPAVG